MAGSGNDIVVVEGVFITETPKATYMRVNGEEVWFPKSQFKRESELKDKDSGLWAVFIPRWLADKNDLDYVDEDDYIDMKAEE